MVTSIVKVKQVISDGLGASEVAAALGISRWKAPITLWLEKTGRAARTPSGEPAEWGHKLEPIIRAEYVERHGVEVRIPKQSEFHPEVTWARATVDGYVYAPIAPSGELARSHSLECKTVGLRLADDWGPDDHREVPDYYLVQAVWQMFVTGVRRVDFAVLLGGQHYFEVIVPHDPALEADVVEGVTNFWRLVQENRVPPADETEAHAKYLRSKIKNVGLVVDAPPDVEALTEKWREIVRASKALEIEENRIKNRILERALEMDVGKFKTNCGRIGVSKPGTTSRTDYQALATDLCNRLQLRGESVNLDDEIASVTTTIPSDGSLRRPNNWTKE